MQNKVFRFNLDIKDKEFKTDFNLVQLDNTSMLVIKLFDEGNKLETTKEDRAEIAIDKNDNTFCVLPCNLYDNEVNCTLDSNALASPGWTNCEVRILNEDKVLTSARFKIYIRENIVNNEKIKSTSEYKALEGLINEAKIMQESLKKGESVLSDVNKLKENLIEIKETILNKNGKIDSNLAAADEKINLIKTYISKSETAIENLTKNQNKIKELSKLLTELEKIRLTLDEINNSINKANTQKVELDKSTENAKNEKISLDDSVKNAKIQNTNLKNVITEAEMSESSLAASTQKGLTQQSELEKTISNSLDKDKCLKETNVKAESLKTDLDSLSENISSKITDGNKLKSNLDTSISNAVTAKSNLDGSIANAESTNTSLTATDTEAKKTESLIRDLINQLDLSKNEINKIIANGDLSKYITEPKLQEVLEDYVKKQDIKGFIYKYVKEESIKIKTMTAVIDQANSNPLTCITYEDDAKKMEKGSDDWDKFFGTKLVLFKNGKEVRDLQDSELNSLKPEDGDVMVKFKRMGLNIKTVGDKVYVSMTNDPDDESFKYYAHTRGTTRKEAFYLGAYLGFLDGNKLRSVTNKNPQDSKSITDFRTYAQANGSGYDLCGFYQLTFLQAMYVLKYGNLDSQTALGKGLTTGGQNFANTTGSTNGKGTDYGTTNSSQQMRFQFIEDFYGNRMWAIDGVATDARCAIYTAKDNFNNSRSGYTNTGVTGPNSEGWTSKVYGTTELGFLSKEFTGSSSTFYADYSTLRANYFLFFGGYTYSSAQTGSFSFYLYPNASDAVWSFSARLMYL